MTERREPIPSKEAQAPIFVGVDLGGTNIKIGVVDDRGRTLLLVGDDGEPMVDK